MSSYLTKLNASPCLIASCIFLRVLNHKILLWFQSKKIISSSIHIKIFSKLDGTINQLHSLNYCLEILAFKLCAVTFSDVENSENTVGTARLRLLLSISLQCNDTRVKYSHSQNVRLLQVLMRIVKRYVNIGVSECKYIYGS